jgi:hypothetical protein
MTAIEKMTQSASEKMECKWKNHIEKSNLENLSRLINFLVEKIK